MITSVTVYDRAAAEGHSCTAQFARPCIAVDAAHTWLCGACGEGLVYPTVGTSCSHCGAEVVAATNSGGSPC